MEIKICPICEMGELEKKEENEKINDLFAGEYVITRTYYVCPVCGEESDFFDENDLNLQNKEKEIRKISITNIINKLSSKGHSLASIERMLELPQRSLTKWKNNHSEASASAVTLLKYVATFPWLLEVADKNFNPQESEIIHWRATFYELWQKCGGENSRLKAADIFEKDNLSKITFTLEKYQVGQKYYNYLPSFYESAATMGNTVKLTGECI